MTDFDKTVYWKGRMNEKITRAFEEVTILLTDVKSNMLHVGADMKECEHALRLIGNGFEELKWTVDAIGEKKEDVKP